jgi:hypothetical protein
MNVRTLNRSFLLALMGLALVALTTVPAFAGATIVINNTDAPGVGLNDTTPATPVGGNPGTTLGAQRLAVFEFAAQVWGTILDSDVPIVVQATFQPLNCTPTSGTLGAAGTLQIFANFPGSQVANTWYQSALANKLAGFDLTPGPPDPGFLQPPFNDDIFAFFNGAIGTDPNCLTGLNWYNGLDHNQAGSDIDLLAVVLHEMGHGLGFANFISEFSGNGPLPAPLDKDIYATFTLDETTGKTWAQMTPAERVASATNNGNVVWSGANVTAQAPGFLNAQAEVVVNSPGSIAGTYTAQPAAYGPSLAAGTITADLELANDGTGVATDGCEPLTNNFAGRIAVVDRGACAFVTKTLNAQAAGASAVIVVNNQPTGLPPMGGTSAAATIPSIGMTFTDGGAIKAELGGGVNATLGLSATVLSGTSSAGRVRLYAPTAVASGSSISHFDTVLTPNALMEPFINGDLSPSTNGADLTRWAFLDEGWMFSDVDGDGVPDVDDACVNSDLGATVVIDGCDSGVSNTLFSDGCTISDLVLACADGAPNHGQFVSCATQVGNSLNGAGAISGADNGAITSCAAGSSLP